MSGAGVALSASALAEIRREAARAYPHEGCGALLGPRPFEVTRTAPLPNAEKGAPRTRFTVSARDYLRVEDEADRAGLLLLGFWHSHPDHPARPSETDRAYAWEGLLTAVIAVEKGVPRDLTLWEIRGREAPFTPLPLRAPAPAVADT